MASVVNFKSRQYIEPSIAAKIIGGTTNPAPNATAGNVLLIDDGIGTGFGAGAGINGELNNGVNAMHFWDNPDDAKRAIRGGIIWDIIDYLFKPDKDGNGCAGLYYVKAATTVSAKSGAVPLAVTAGVTGSVTFAARDENTGANGVILNSILTKGYGWKIKAGIINTAKFIIEFYQGQFRGLDGNGQPFDQAESQVANNRILQTPEFATANELITWMTNDFYFNQYFKLIASTASADTIAAAVLATYSGMQIFTGATETFNGTDVDSVLNVAGDLDFNLILAAGFGTNGGGVNNTKIWNFIKNVSEFERIMFIGGGIDATKYSGASDCSVDIATYFDSELAVVVHSGIKMPVPSTSGIGVAYKNLSAFYSAALVCGIVAGLNPQQPATYKKVRISGVLDAMPKSTREQALQRGVLHFRNTKKGWVINQGINSKQQNTYLMNPDGTSYEISVVRVAGQLNKELIADSLDFIGTNEGAVDAIDMKNFTQQFLLDRTARKIGSGGAGGDNLITAWQNVEVNLIQDYWDIKYGYAINSPINKIFYTGIAVDPTVQA